MKKIKFPLIQKNDFPVRSIEELREHFDLTKIIGYFMDGKLQIWLEQRYYESEATAIKKLNKTDFDLHKKICDILGVEYHKEDFTFDIDVESDRSKRLSELKQYTSDQEILDKIDDVAFNQEELAYLIDKNIHDIYLCNNTFHIPLRVPNKKYVGIGKVICVIKSKREIDFWVKRIEFVNVEFDSEYREIHTPTPEKLYQLGCNCERNKEYFIARDYFTRAIKAENSNAVLKLATEYMNHGRIGGNIFYEILSFSTKGLNDYLIEYIKKTTAEKEKLSNESFVKAATAGNTEAMKYLGDIEVDKKNYSKSKEWFQKAADAGDTKALMRIAYCYYYGINGYIKDEETAISLYKKAINMEPALAMDSLTKIYEEKKDYTFHHQWFRRLLSDNNIDNGQTDLFFWMLARNNFTLPNYDHAKFASGILIICDNMLKSTAFDDSVNVLMHAAQVCSRLDRFDTAMEFVARAFDAADGWSFYLYRVYECLGDIYKYEGLFENAIKAYKKGISVDLECTLPPYDTLEYGNLPSIVEKLEQCKKQMSLKI